MPLNKLEETIEKAFGDGRSIGDHLIIPSTSRKYNISEIKHGVFKPDRADLESFKIAYGGIPDQITGYGEAAFYWLFNYHSANRKDDGTIKTQFIKENQGSNNPDLIATQHKTSGKSTAFEIKAYPLAKNSLDSLGRFEKSLRDFRNLIAPILGVQALIGEPGVDAKDVLRLKSSDLEPAAEAFCELRTIVKKEGLAKKYKLFAKMEAQFDHFDKMVKERGLSDCAFGGGSRPGGKHIATRLFAYAVIQTLSIKPGKDQFYVNMVGSEGKYDESAGIQIYQVNLDKVTKDPAVIANDIALAGGIFKLKFKTVLPV